MTEPNIHDEYRHFLETSNRAELDDRVSALRTVCCILGPYRNLTTLTASLFALHPVCRVLNMAAMRILPLPEVDFPGDPSPETMRRFLRYALYLAEAGERGDRGGSITLSHAFDHDVVRRRYAESLEAASGTLPQVLVWKDPLYLSNRLHEPDVVPSRLLELHPRLQFLLPIRNPMDCAVSNLKTGHARRFPGLREETVEDVLRCVLEELVRFFENRTDYPDRCFFFSQNAMDRRTLEALAGFLEISPTESWTRAALDCIRLKPSYEHSEEFVDCCSRLIDEKAANVPELRAILEEFLPVG